MLIRFARASEPPPSSITPEADFVRRGQQRQQQAGQDLRSSGHARRHFLGGALGLLGAAAMPAPVSAEEAPPGNTPRIPDLQPTRYGADLSPTAWEYITGYNNFYEFGVDKTDPAANAGKLVTRPWSIVVDGECESPGEIGIEDILAGFPQEERIYRLRCVEAWSMVVPWVGFSLGDLLKRFRPTAKAKYVAFETLVDRETMPGTRRRILDWPYREGLRIDEAMHPLTLLATGVYGRELPPQNGAPVRLVVPWKYGFKSIKSIVRIRFVAREPRTTWSDMAANEYGFYANVNPAVAHPRWSQKYHRIIGAGLFASREETLPFNGYADEVAGLYRGMDLARYY